MDRLAVEMVRHGCGLEGRLARRSRVWSQAGVAVWGAVVDRVGMQWRQRREGAVASG